MNIGMNRKYTLDRHRAGVTRKDSVLALAILAVLIVVMVSFTVSVLVDTRIGFMANAFGGELAAAASHPGQHRLGRSC